MRGGSPQHRGPWAEHRSVWFLTSLSELQFLDHVNPLRSVKTGKEEIGRSDLQENIKENQREILWCKEKKGRSQSQKAASFHSGKVNNILWSLNVVKQTQNLCCTCLQLAAVTVHFVFLIKVPVLSIQYCSHVPISVSYVFWGNVITITLIPTLFLVLFGPWVNHLIPEFIIVNRFGFAITSICIFVPGSSTWHLNMFLKLWEPQFSLLTSIYKVIIRVKEAKLDNRTEQCRTHSRPSGKSSCLFPSAIPHFEDGRDEGKEQKRPACSPQAAIVPPCVHGKHSNWSHPSSFWNQKEPQNPSQYTTLSCFYQVHRCDSWDETSLLSLDLVIAKVGAETIWTHNKWSPISKTIQLSGRQIFQS